MDTFSSGIIAENTPSAPFLTKIFLLLLFVKIELTLSEPPNNTGCLTQQSKIFLTAFCSIPSNFDGSANLVKA